MAVIKSTDKALGMMFESSRFRLTQEASSMLILKSVSLFWLNAQCSTGPKWAGWSWSSII